MIRCLIIDGTLADINPYRYRGYRFDVETGYYYLQSRYYNPQIGRFISADGILGETGNLLTQNMYAYAGNNPVMNLDPNGDFYGTLFIFTVLTFAILGGSTSIQYGAEIGSQKFWIGFGTGALVGMAVFGIATYNPEYLAFGINSLYSKFQTDYITYTQFGAKWGTWEDYSVAFIFGGFIGGRFGKLPNIAGGSIDSIVRPLVNQLVRMGTSSQKSFQDKKYYYDVITRA